MNLKVFSQMGVLLLFSSSAIAWGKFGHEITGEIAWQLLSSDTKAKVQRATGLKNLRKASYWPDSIRGQKRYRKYGHYHYATVPDKATYKPPLNPKAEGMAVEILQEAISGLKKSKSLKGFTKTQSLYWVVHLIGDIHQPLHVGRPGLKGGNLVSVSLGNKKINLHRYWDSIVMKAKEPPFDDFVREILERANIEQWDKSGQVKDWVKESIDLRALVYDFEPKDSVYPLSLQALPKPRDSKTLKEYLIVRGQKRKTRKAIVLSKHYQERSLLIAEQRLFQAGARTAKVIKEIYGTPKKKVKP